MHASWLAIAFLCAAVAVVNGEFDWTVLSPYNYPSKRLSPGVFTGGRLTESGLMLLSQANFASVISVADFPTDDSSYNSVNGDFPSSSREAEIVISAGMQMIQLDNMLLDAESVDRFTQAILKAPKPVFVHCHVGYAATLYALLFQFCAGVLITDEGTASIYSSGIAHGWDYQANANVVALVNKITAASSSVVPPSIDLLLSTGGYQGYFWTHRIGDDHWYNTGQILDTQITAIAAAGYGAVVSFREDGETTTHVPASDCSTNTPCPDNHQFVNPNGSYNVTLERNAVTAAGMQFFNLPVGENDWNVATLNKYKVLLDSAVLNGRPVLVHCKSGYRSSAFTVAYLAQVKKQCVTWAVQQASLIGYSFDVDSDDTTVLDFFQQALTC